MLIFEECIQRKPKMDLVSLIKELRSGVVQLFIERNRELLGFGSGFLVEGGIITNSLNIRSRETDVIAIRFDDLDPNDSSNYIRISPDDYVKAESPQGEKDFAFLQMDQPEFGGRHHFELVDSSTPGEVGEKAIFLGFPFGMTHLTTHIGFISSIHSANGVKIIQIDGSINGGNSGGPLVEIKSGKVIGIVTRSVTGLIEQQFIALINALQQNQKALRNVVGMMSLGPVDPIQAIISSQAAMEQIAKDLHRSANVGIGYAYSVDYAREAIKNLPDQS